MSDEGQKPGAEPGGTDTPPETVIDIGGGNTFNRQQIIDLKGAKEGIEAEYKTHKQTTTDKIAELEKSANGYVEANRLRIEADAAKETAEARAKELELRLSGYVAPEVYKEIKETNDLLILKGVADKVDGAVTKYGVDKSDFDGKTAEQVDAFIEGLSKTKPAPKAPNMPSGSAHGQSPAQSAHQKNLEAVEKVWGKSNE